MITTLRYRHFNSAPSMDHAIEKAFSALGRATRIDEADVTLTFDKTASPAYRARLEVAVPGPDYVVEMHGSTADQAFYRALTLLERKMRLRHLRRESQRVTNRKHAANFRIGRRSR